MMTSLGLNVPEYSGTVVYAAESVSDGARYLGSIVIADEPKPTSRAAVEGLKGIGVKKCVMLTGDAPAAAELVYI